jgi:FRG domain
VENLIEVIQCSSWDDFMKNVRLTRTLGTRYFRGHAVPQWKLSSAWERLLMLWKSMPGDYMKEFTANRETLDRFQNQYLERFKEHVTGTPGLRMDRITGEEHWWALGRHHGLRSPLLDWTRSPYVAAFFAFIGLMEIKSPGFPANYGTAKTLQLGPEPVVIWEFDRDAGIQRLEEEGMLKVFVSRLDDAHRQKAQQGVFTWLRCPDHYDLESFLVTRGNELSLRKFEVPAAQFKIALYDLFMMNITYATLFPDMEGAARMANGFDFFNEININPNALK